MQRIIILLVFILVYSKLSGQELLFNSEVEEALPFPNTSVTLKESWIKEREELNTKYLKSLDPDELLHNFRVNAGLPSDATPLDGWEAPWVELRGHFTGHYLSSIAFLVEKHDDPILTRRLNYMVEELYKCQQALGNGYLSAFPETLFDVLEKNFGGVWAPYYTYNKIMQGLLDAYVYAGNEKALEMVVNMASYVNRRMAKLDEETIEKVLYSVGANPTNEAGAMNEVLYKLYKVTKDPDHLSLAKVFDRDWFLSPMARNKNILSGLHSNTHIVLVNGFTQAYTINKDEKYRDAIVNFWDMLINYHIYANGSSSGPRPNVVTPTSLTAEHWGVPGQLSNTMTKEIAETCVSHNTQKLTEALFSLTADPKYADAYMNTFYNSILALQSANSGKYVYHLPLGSPREKEFMEDNDFKCCSGSSIEAFTQLNSAIYFHNNETLWVNLYVPSKLKWDDKNIELTQTGSFPMESSVEFKMSAAESMEFDLKLLIPSWTEKVDVFINDKKQNYITSPESYLVLSREWEDKDRIRLDFNYDFHIKTMPDDNNVIALFYGPMLLAFENSWELTLKGDHETILSNLYVGEKSNIFHLENNGHIYRLRPLFEIEDQTYGVYATIRNY